MKNNLKIITFVVFSALMLVFSVKAMAETTTDVSNGADDVATTTTPPGGGNPGGGSSGGSSNTVTGGGSSNGGGFSGNPALTGALSVTPATTSCPLITEYLKLGNENNGVQVSRLQIFLKDSEKSDVDVTGIFDQKTEDAVKAFQIKYLSDILGPWDADLANGFVYITTSKKINELACALPIVISPKEQAIIDQYKAREPAQLVVANNSSIEASNSGAPGTLEVVDTSDNENAAAVGGASILERFWNFIKNLFR